MNEHDHILMQARISQELLRRKAKQTYRTYVRYIKEDYTMKWFHAYICEKLDQFVQGKIKKMMILMPVQHGKSEIASRLFPSYMLGQNPDSRIGLVTYNDTFAQKFNRQIQRYMDSEKYIRIFPDTKLNNSKITGVHRDNYARNNHTFEMVDRKGGMITVGRDGQITGLPIDVLIIDDLYKNREEATSQAVSEKIWTDYNDVFLTRLHNDSQQLIMNTRWDEADLVGRLLKQEANDWEVITFPAIKTADVVPYDKRKEGEALWPEKHSLERILRVKEKQQVTFNSLYQQDPQPNTELLIYPSIVVIPEFPQHLEKKYWGLDFGFTNDPTALIKCGHDEENSYYHECHYSPGTPMKYIKESLVANGWQYGEIVYCDHVDANIVELRRLGVTAVPAIKGPGSLQAGIVKMKERKIHVTATSLNMLLERRKYQWKTYGTIITNEPIDQWNHCWDGARMGTFTSTFR
jgi:hypothetical protein